MEDQVCVGGRYHITEWIGSGGEGVVYRGFDSRLKKEVAVKKLKQIDIDELVGLAEIEHPAFPRVTDVICEDGTNYLVMDLVSGEDALSYVENRGVMAQEELEDFAKQLCSAMLYLHQEKNAIHGDLKPSNILIGNDGKISLIDCKVHKKENEPVMGTQGYAAPETLSFNEISKSSDIYAYGASLYFLGTGKVPSDNPKPPSLYNSGIGVDLERIILKAMSQLPAQRYCNFNEVSQELNSNRRVYSPIGLKSFCFANNPEAAIEFAYVLQKELRLKPLIVMTQKAYSSVACISYPAEKAISLIQLIEGKSRANELSKSYAYLMKNLPLILVPDIDGAREKIEKLLEGSKMYPIIWCTMWEENSEGSMVIASISESLSGLSYLANMIEKYKSYSLVAFDGILTYNEVQRVLGKENESLLVGVVPFSKERSRARLDRKFLLSTMPEEIEKAYIELAQNLGIEGEEFKNEQAAYGNKRRRRC